MELKEKVDLLERELLETKKLLRAGGAVAEPVLHVTEPFISKTRESGILNFSYELPSGEEKELEEKMPWNGWCISALIDWPKGCKNLAGARITIDGERIVPKNEQWVSLNGVTIAVPIVQKVKKDRLIKVDFKNNDLLKSHYLTVLVSIYNYFPELPIMGV